jgi:hypothetical protein
MTVSSKLPMRRLGMENTAMCEKCLEIDGKIEHYRGIASKITDQAMLRGIEVLIDRARARKAELHTEQQR